MVSAIATNQGVRKLFLRFPSDSPLIDGAMRAGFSSYTTEHMYRYSGEGGQMAAEAPEPYVLRPKASGDEYMLFDLHSAALPLPVRTAEGMTMGEWQESRGRGFWLEQRHEFVLEKQGSLVAWLRVNASLRVGSFTIMFHRLDDDGLEWLVNYGLMCLNGKSPIVCVASAYQERLLRLLEETEFEKAAQSIKMVKELAIRIKEPSFMPVQA